MKFQSIKKFTALFLTLLLLLVFTGCSPASEPPADTADGNQAETFTITDQAGRTVEIPNNVESVAMTWGPAANFVLALGKGDIISAFNYSGEFAAKVSPNLANVSSVGKGKPDMEALAKLKPDVFIHKANDTATLEAVQDLGIPAVGIYSETQDDLLVATELVGKVLGAEEQATKLINFYNEKINFAADLVKDIPADERKTVIVMGSEIGKVANGTMLQSFLIETAGGINLAKDIVSEETWPTVGTEQIFSWDPDYIFCVNSSQATYSPEELKADASFANLKAVKNDQIAIVPSDQDLWDFPGVQSCLGVLWMLNQMYPDLYSEADLIKDIDAFYNLAYGMTFDREWLGY